MDGNKTITNSMKQKAHLDKQTRIKGFFRSCNQFIYLNSNTNNPPKIIVPPTLIHKAVEEAPLII